MDVTETKSRKFRFFEIIPGFLTWLALTSPIWLGFFAPSLVVLTLTFLSIYWIYLAFTHSVGIIIGYKRYKSELAIDWHKECLKLNFADLPDKATLPKSLAEVKHLILVPAVNESIEILDSTLGAIANQNYSEKDGVFITVTCEERGSESVGESVQILREKYKDQIKHLFFYVHPGGIPGELVGGGAPNRTWGAKHAIEELKKLEVNLDNVIFTTFDADTNIHREFISRLTHLYLTTDRRFHHFYSTVVHLFNNNIWEVHTLMRIEANCITLGTLSSWTLNHETRETFSCYSVSLNTLLAADFWDPALIDDSVFYWRAFFARNGEFSPRIFYIPNSSDAVHADSFIKAHKSLYKQLLRWGWGSVTTPIALEGFSEHKNIPLKIKLSWAYNKIERHLVFRTIVFLITFGFAILTLVNEGVRQTTVAYRLPDVISAILTFGLILLIPTTIIRGKLITPPPKKRGYIRRFFSLLEGPLVIINLLTFSFLPYLEAETRMMLGKGFKVLHFTPKYR